MPADRIRVYLEIGSKKTFAGALDWPGWCRSGHGEGAAMKALFDYGPRYAGVLERAGAEFPGPGSQSSFEVVERLAGNATTDFGAPNLAPSADAQPLNEAELARCHSLLKACWQAFDASLQAAGGKELCRGPSGGGRDLDKMIQHVLAADGGYLGRVGWKLPDRSGLDLPGQFQRARQAVLDALDRAAHGGIEPLGPRGGVRWTARYFVRRVTWHVLDHAWEIEDRVIEA